MIGYSLKEIGNKFRLGIYQKSEVDSALALKPNSVAMLQAIGNINSPLLDMPLKNSLAMKSGVGSATFTRASTAKYIDRYGMLKSAAINEPRFEKEGYLNEGGSTNLLTYSEDFSNAYWFKEASTLTANTTDTLDPYGTNLAEKIMETAVTSSHALYTANSIPFTAGATYAQSWFIKPNGRTKFRVTSWNGAAFTTTRGILIDLVAKTSTVIEGTVLSHGIIELANGWFRVWLSYTADETGTQFGAMMRPRLDDGLNEYYLGDVTKGFYIFGAQLEAMPFATSYIPTVASTVTRSADVLSVSYNGNIPNVADDYTIAIDASTLGFLSTTYQTFIRPNDDGRMIRGNSVEIDFRGSGVNRATTPMIKNTIYRLTYSVGTLLSAYVNGILIGSIAKGAGSGVLSLINIGHYSSTTSMYGHITNVRIYDKELTAQEVALA